MSGVLENRVRETIVSSGQGVQLTLGGAVSGNVRFASQYSATTQLITYTIEENDGVNVNFEIGLGTYDPTQPTIFTKTQITEKLEDGIFSQSVGLLDGLDLGVSSLKQIFVGISANDSNNKYQEGDDIVANTLTIPQGDVFNLIQSIPQGPQGPQGPAGLDGPDTFFGLSDTPNSAAPNVGNFAYVAPDQTVQFQQVGPDTRLKLETIGVGGSPVAILSLPVNASSVVQIEGTIFALNDSTGETYTAQFFGLADDSQLFGRFVNDGNILPPAGWAVDVVFNSGNINLNVTGAARWVVRYQTQALSGVNAGLALAASAVGEV